MQQRFEKRAPFKRSVPVRYGHDKTPARPRKIVKPVEKGRRIFYVLQNFGRDHAIKRLLLIECVDGRETNVFRKIGIADGVDRFDIDIGAQELAIAE